MKRCFLISLFILPVGALAQSNGNNSVPWNVKIQFMEDYISAGNVKWQQYPDNNYKVIFFHQSQNKAATYSSEGLKLAAKTKLTSLFQLPENIVRSTKRRFKKYIIEDISKIESPQQITYEIIARKERSTYNLIFEPSGKFKKKKA
jgi:hypothetical protein